MVCGLLNTAQFAFAFFFLSIFLFWLHLLLCLLVGLCAISQDWFSSVNLVGGHIVMITRSLSFLLLLVCVLSLMTNWLDSVACLFHWLFIHLNTKIPLFLITHFNYTNILVLLCWFCNAYNHVLILSVPPFTVSPPFLHLPRVPFPSPYISSLIFRSFLKCHLMLKGMCR